MDLIQGQKQLNKFLRLFLVGLLLLAAGPVRPKVDPL